MVERTAVNPWSWSVNFGFNQGELVEGATRTLYCAGQTSVDENGAPQHVADMAGQIALAADNLDAVLRQFDQFRFHLFQQLKFCLTALPRTNQVTGAA